MPPTFTNPNKVRGGRLGPAYTTTWYHATTRSNAKKIMRSNLSPSYKQGIRMSSMMTHKANVKRYAAYPGTSNLWVRPLSKAEKRRNPVRKRAILKITIPKKELNKYVGTLAGTRGTPFGMHGIIKRPIPAKYIRKTRTPVVLPLGKGRRIRRQLRFG